MKRKCLKRTGLLLALLMLISLLPLGSLSAFAEEPAEPIEEAGLSLTLPQPGPTGAEEGQPVPASVSVLFGMGYSVQSASWFLSSGAVPSSFEAGQSYYAEILLVPAEGFFFPENCPVSVDSAAVNTAALDADGNLRIVTAEVTLTEPFDGFYPVWINGVQVSDDNRSDILQDGRASYDPSAKTLTLNEAEISNLCYPGNALILAEDLDLTVKGSAVLESDFADLGIYSLNASLTLEGDFTIRTGGPALFSDKDLTVEDGKITAESVWPDQPCMKVRGDVTVKKGQLSLTAPGGGILAEGSFTLEEEGVVKATATAIDCDSALTQYGVSAQAIAIKGGDLTAKGLTGGICAAKDLIVSGGVLLAEGQTYGIYVIEGALDIQNSAQRVTAEGKEADGAILASSIRLGSLVGVTEPAGGKVGDDGKHITEADGSSIAGRAVIESSATYFTVSFETYGGPEVSSRKVLEGEPVGKPADPEFSPFTFEGWFLDPADSSAPYDFSAPVTEDLSLKARWTTTVMASVKDSEGTANLGGTVSLGGETYETSLSATVWRDGEGYQASCKADEGYTFDHWEDGLGKMLPYLEPSFPFSVKDGPKIFVAVFMKDAPAVHTVTLDSDGGEPEFLTVETDDQGMLDPEQLAFLGNAFFREGYELTGWSLTPGGKALDVGSYTFTRDETLYALWAPRHYTVSFETNGGSTVPAQSVAFGKTAFQPDDPVKNGNTFGGWYADRELTQAFDFSAPITEDTVIYAKWEQVVKYTVVSGGGSIYGKTSGKELVITVKRTPKDAECFRHFTGVRLDGAALILDSDYTAQEGSTVITLKPGYLSTLNSGSHIVTILFDDGKASTGITVKAGSGGTSKRGGSGSGGGSNAPATGDPGTPMLWAGLLFASAAGLGTMAISGRKLRRAARR